MRVEIDRSLKIDPSAATLSRSRRLLLLAYLALSSGAALFAACEACIAEWRGASTAAISVPESQPFVSHDSARLTKARGAGVQTATGPSDEHP